MPTEEVLIRMGLDARPVSRGLRELRKTVGEGVSAMAAGVRKSLNGMFQTLAAPVTLAGLAASLNKALSAVEAIRNTSEATGLSTGLVQDIRNLGEASGVAGEKVDKMLGKFSAGLGSGSNADAELMKFADHLKSIEDPADRARAVIDKLGESGLKLLPILSQGSEGLSEMAGEFSKFTESDMKALEDADQILDGLTNRITIYTGKFVEALAFGSRVFGKMSTSAKYWRIGGGQQAMAELDAEDNEAADTQRKIAAAAAAQRKQIEDSRNAARELAKHQEAYAFQTSDANAKLAILNRQLKETYALADGESSPEAWGRHMERARDLMKQIADIQKAADAAHSKARADDLEKAGKLAAAETASRQAAQDLLTAKGERTKFSLGDLANANIDRFTTRDMAGQIMGARRVRYLEGQAREYAIHGYATQADSMLSEADKLRSGLTALTENERAPFASLEKSAREQARHLADLAGQAKTGGLPVKLQLAD